MNLIKKLLNLFNLNKKLMLRILAGVVAVVVVTTGTLLTYNLLKSPNLVSKPASKNSVSQSVSSQSKNSVSQSVSSQNQDSYSEAASSMADDEWDSESDSYPDTTVAPVADTSQQIEGLSDPSIVGINKDDFVNEVKYPVPTKPDYVFSATDYGVKANDKMDDTIGLQAAISAAKSKPSSATKVILLPKGDLDFIQGFNSIDNTFGIVIDGIDNLTIEGQDTNIYYYGNSDMNGMEVSNSTNFLLTKVNVDWGTLPFMMGVVQSFDANSKTAVIKVDQGYTVNSSTQVIEYQEYNKTSDLPRDGGNFLYNINATTQISKVTYLGDNTLQLKFSVSVTQAPVGTKVALSQTMYGSESYILKNCTNAKFESDNLYSTPGMGMRAYSCDNLYFNRFNCVTKPGTDRLMTVTADILHLNDTKGEISITNCTLENSHDDAINVCGSYLRVQEIDGDTVRVLSANGMGETFEPSVGDVYELSDIVTLAPIEDLTIASVAPCSNGYLVTFKEGIKGVTVGNAMANLTRSPKLIFDNNLVRNKRNRGILVQTRNVEIENNCFSNVLNGAIQLVADVNNFNESISPKDVTIENNKFIDNNAGADADIGVVAYGEGMSIGSPDAISNLTIENNFMAYSKNAAMEFRGASNITVSHNLIYDPATNPTNGNNNCAISLQNAAKLTFDTNKVYGGTKLGFKSISIIGGVDVNPTNLKLENNDGILESDVYGEAPTIQIDKSDKPINVDDNSLSDWNNVGTPIEMKACTDINVQEVDLNSISPSDFSVNAKMLWKDDGIYFSFDVTDDSIVWNQSEWWLGDGLEMFLTTETQSYADTGAVRLTNDDTVQFYTTPPAAGGTGGIGFFQPRTSAAVLANKSQFKLSIWLTSKGYQGEGYIPFTAMPGIKTSIDAGKPVAMSMNFGDADTDPTHILKTFSTVMHPTSANKMIPANMTKVIFKQ